MPEETSGSSERAGFQGEARGFVEERMGIRTSHLPYPARQAAQGTVSFVVHLYFFG